MDCVFNRFIPRTSQDTLIIRPYGKTFANGMAQTFSYDDYDETLLKGHLTRREFESVIEEVNNHIFSRYPCIGCQMFAYLCCLCTVGFSCIIPYLQVREAEREARKKIDYLNQKIRPRNLKMQLRVENQTSYIIMYLPNHKIWDKNKIKTQEGDATQQQQIQTNL